MSEKQKRGYKVSIIVPLHNEEGNISVLISKLSEVLEQYRDYEILLIDDGSRDDTLEIIKIEQRKNNKIKYISFSRNFGHQSALRAGLDHATGDCVISMDGDMQHPPELIPKMISLWLEGYDIVYTKRDDRTYESIFKKITSYIFYAGLNWISEVKIEHGTADFRLLGENVIEVIRKLPESDLFLRGMISWVGFKQIGIDYTPNERYSGKRAYTLKKMLRLAEDGVTGFSVQPLRIITYFGLFLLSTSILLSFFFIFRWVAQEVSYSDMYYLFTMMMGFTSLLILAIGVTGFYIGKLFNQAKGRPNYIIKESRL